MFQGILPMDSHFFDSTPLLAPGALIPHGHALGARVKRIHTLHNLPFLLPSKRKRGKGREDGREAHTPVVSLAPGWGERHAHDGILECKAILAELESGSTSIAVQTMVSLIAVEGPRVCLDGIQILPLLETLVPLALGVGRHRCNPSHALIFSEFP
jgi:hypothetical protein